MRMTTRQVAARKAAMVRRVRAEFKKRYPDTYFIAAEILRGEKTQDIVDDYDVSKGTVAAVKANLTRGGTTFSTLAYLCNYKK